MQWRERREQKSERVRMANLEGGGGGRTERRKGGRERERKRKREEIWISNKRSGRERRKRESG